MSTWAQHPVCIAVAADHAGFELKQEIAADLIERGFDVLDLGTTSSEPVDYPDYAEAAALALCDARATRAVLVCGSGVGAAIVANKVPGVRAGVCHDVYSARQAVEDDDLTVLALGARVIGAALAKEVVRAFVSARFSGELRHRRRLEKLAAIEARYASRAGSGG